MNRELRIKNQNVSCLPRTVAKRLVRGFMILFLASFLFLVLSTPALADEASCNLECGPNYSICQNTSCRERCYGNRVTVDYEELANCLQDCYLNFCASHFTECKDNCLLREGVEPGRMVEIKKEELGPAQETKAELPPLYDPLAGKKPAVVVGGLIQTVLSIVGSLALVIFVYAGIMWMTSAGNEEKALHAAKMMVWAALGLVVIFSSYIVLNFVFKVVTAT